MARLPSSYLSGLFAGPALEFGTVQEQVPGASMTVARTPIPNTPPAANPAAPIVPSANRRGIPSPVNRLPVSDWSADREAAARAGRAAGNARLAAARDNPALRAQMEANRTPKRLPQLTPAEIAAGAKLEVSDGGLPQGSIGFQRKTGGYSVRLADGSQKDFEDEREARAAFAAPAAGAPAAGAPAAALSQVATPTPDSSRLPVDISTDYAANNAATGTAPVPVSYVGPATTAPFPTVSVEPVTRPGFIGGLIDAIAPLPAKVRADLLSKGVDVYAKEPSKVKADAQKTTSEAKAAEATAKAAAAVKSNESKIALVNAQSQSLFLKDLLERRREAAQNTPAAISSRLQSILA